MSEKTFKVVVVVLGLAVCYLTVITGNYTVNSKKQQQFISNLKNNLDSVSRIKDSLSDEVFYTSIELNRYEMAYQIFMERNPEAANQYGTIISEETE